MNIVFEFQSLVVENVCVPSFTVRKGDWVVLHWPTKFGSAAEWKFYDLLLQLDFFGCDFPTKPHIVLPDGRIIKPLLEKGVEQPKTVENILHSLPDGDRYLLESELAQALISIECPMNHLPGTPRLLVGLLSALAETRFLVFNVAGLDPLGIQKIYTLVALKTAEGFSFLEMVFPGARTQRPQNLCVKFLEARVIK